MLLVNSKIGTLGIVYESAISEKTVPTFFFAKKNVLRRNGMNYTSMERRNVKVLRDMGQKMGESRIFCIQAILTDCSKVESSRSRESRIPVTRLSKMTSDV